MKLIFFVINRHDFYVEHEHEIVKWYFKISVFQITSFQSVLVTLVSPPVIFIRELILKSNLSDFEQLVWF